MVVTLVCAAEGPGECKHMDQASGAETTATVSSCEVTGMKGIDSTAEPIQGQSSPWAVCAEKLMRWRQNKDGSGRLLE